MTRKPHVNCTMRRKGGLVEDRKYGVVVCNDAGEEATTDEGMTINEDKEDER